MGYKVKLLFLGFDGLDGQMLETWKPQNLDKLGTYGTMESVRPVFTGPNWGSIYTGKPPNAHGITAGGWTVGKLWFNHIKIPTIWDKLHSVGAFNMPLTWPPRKINGWLVSGFPCLEDREITYPKEIRGFLPQGLNYVSDISGGRTPITDFFLNGRDGFRDLDYVDLIALTRRIAKYRLKYVKRIFREHPVDTLAIGYTFPDRIGHHKETSFFDILTLLEEILSSICRTFKYDWLISCSDHGISNRNHTIDAFYLTNFGARPKSVMDIHDLVMVRAKK